MSCLSSCLYVRLARQLRRAVRGPIVLCASLVLASLAAAQAPLLLQNGGFESGLTPWRASGAGANVRTEAAALCGNRVVTAALGADLTSNKHVALAQDASLPAGELLLGVDVSFQFAASTVFQSTVEVHVASQLVKVWTGGGSGTMGGSLGYGYFEPIQVAVAGRQEFRVTVRYSETVGQGARVRLDNLVLMPRTTPVMRHPLCPLSSRQSRIWTAGSDLVWTALWVDTGLTTPWRHPVFRGAWELDQSRMVLVGVERSGTHGGNAGFRMPLVTSSLVGRSFAFQALEIDPARGIYSFGLPALRRLVQ